VAFTVRVIPRAGRTAIAGVRGESLLVRLAAAPVDGAANDALVRVLAGALGCAPRDVTITAGLTSRTKRVAVAGLDAATVGARLSGIVGGI
jgi:uncharacterized protein